MEFALKFFFVVAVLVGLGYLGAHCCVTDKGVKNSFFVETPCAAVMSNGKHNPHYMNMMQSCDSKCSNNGKSPMLDVQSCVCSCY